MLALLKGIKVDRSPGPYGIYPKLFKIVPVKKGNMDKPGNYKLISPTSMLGNNIGVRIHQHPLKHGLIRDGQHCFVW